MGILRPLLGASLLIAGQVAHAQTVTMEDLTPRQDMSGHLPSLEALTRPPRSEEFRGMAEEIARQGARETMEELRRQGRAMGVQAAIEDPAAALAAAPGVARLPDGIRATIFISSSLGDRTLTQMFASHRGRKDVRFVFRGVPDGMNIPDFGLWLTELAGPDAIQTLNITLDPELFELTGTEVVPAMILEDLRARDEQLPADIDTGRIIARAIGFSDPDWLNRRAEAGDTDVRATTTQLVAEEDLRERAMREAAAVQARLTRDPEVLVGRFWDRQRDSLAAMPVTPAAADRLRQLHFISRAEKEITDHQGKVLAFAGEIFQPSDVVDFDRRIIIFDPNREDELAHVSALLAEARPGVAATILIATRLPATGPEERPWDGLQRLITRYGMGVFLLNDQLRSAFRVEHTPTEIYPQQAGGRVDVLSQETSVGG